MSDLELLDLAAKAAGIGPLDWDYSQREGHGLNLGARLPMPTGVLMAAIHTYWSPLTDDGDALRLAVKLGIDVCFGANYVIARGSVQIPTVNNANDPCAATRHAIVRAAAEIGRAMQ